MRKIVPATEENIKLGAKLLAEGKLVAFPTETVYGLGAVFCLESAVARIFEAKRRPFFDPLIVHVASKKDVSYLWQKVPPRVNLLLERFWPGPLTLVLPKKETVPDIVTAGLDTVAVRMPAHPVALKLIEYCGFPVAAPSANLFGHVSPTRAEDVEEDLGDEVDLILDGGITSVGVESTIILFEEEKFFLLRPGGVPVELIEEVIGEKVVTRKNLPARTLAPGMLKTHYAPRVPLYIFEGEAEELKKADFEKGIALLSPRPLSFSGDAVFVLSENGDLREVAFRLFAALRKLERERAEKALAIPVPEVGLGRAIMDRLRKASRGTARVVGGKLVFVEAEK